MMLEVSLWILTAAFIVFCVVKVLLDDSFLLSMVSLVVIAACGVIPPTLADQQVPSWVWVAALPAIVAGWVARPLNALAGPVRSKAADGGIYHFTDEDRAVMRRAQIITGWKPLVAVGVVVALGSFFAPFSALLGAASVGFASAALLGIVSRRLAGMAEIRS